MCQFVATLVALHITPVSDLVGQWVIVSKLDLTGSGYICIYLDILGTSRMDLDDILQLCSAAHFIVSDVVVILPRSRDLKLVLKLFGTF